MWGQTGTKILNHVALGLPMWSRRSGRRCCRKRHGIEACVTLAPREESVTQAIGVGGTIQG